MIKQIKCLKWGLSINKKIIICTQFSSLEAKLEHLERSTSLKKFEKFFVKLLNIVYVYDCVGVSEKFRNNYVISFDIQMPYKKRYICYFNLIKNLMWVYYTIKKFSFYSAGISMYLYVENINSIFVTYEKRNI